MDRYSRLMRERERQRDGWGQKIRREAEHEGEFKRTQGVREKNVKNRGERRGAEGA